MKILNSRFEQKVGVWSGILYAVGLGLGWWLVAGFVPPPSPSAGAAEIAQIFQEDPFRIRVGMIIIMFSAMMYIPWTALLTRFIAEIEQGIGLLSIWQIMAGTCNVMLTFYPPILWAVTAYRPDRPIEITYVLNDIGWLMFVGGLTPLLPAVIAIGIASFKKQPGRIIFPRWLGYFCFWCTLLFLPGQLMFFFWDGPFAWDGLLAFWLPITVFGIWFVVMFRVLFQAIDNQEHPNTTTQGEDHAQVR